MHVIARSSDMSGFIRDFKTFTSKEIKKNIMETEPQILKLFKEGEEYHFWQNTNMPRKIRKIRDTSRIISPCKSGKAGL
jgi:phosphoribulokinase